MTGGGVADCARSGGNNNRNRISVAATLETLRSRRWQLIGGNPAPHGEPMADFALRIGIRFISADSG